MAVKKLKCLLKVANHCEKTQNDQNEIQIDQQGAQMTRKRCKITLKG